MSQKSLFEEPERIPGPDEIPPPNARTPRHPDFHRFLERMRSRASTEQYPFLQSAWYHPSPGGRFLTLVATPYMVLGVWADEVTTPGAKPLDLDMMGASWALKMLACKPTLSFEAPLKSDQARSLREWAGTPHWLEPCRWCRALGVVPCPECHGRLESCEVCEMTAEISCVECEGTGWYVPTIERSQIWFPPRFAEGITVDRTKVAQVIETFAEMDAWAHRPVYMTRTMLGGARHGTALILEAGGPPTPGFGWRASIAGMSADDGGQAIPTWPQEET